MPISRSSGGTRSWLDDTTRPATEMRPLSGFSKPAISRNVVVFPHPEGPSRVTNSPDPIERLKSITPALLPAGAG
jgi:hypothetical protein